MITNLQIKAARMLLNWSQHDLAKASQVSLATLAMIEQGKGSARPTTLMKLQTTMMEAGIEFTDEPGVRVSRQKFNLDVWEGHESILKVWRDIESTLYKKGGEVLLSGVDERIWIKKYEEDLRDILQWRKSYNITTRLLIAEGDGLLTGSPEYYRAIPKALFQQTPYYVYADKIALINWGPPQTVLLLRNEMIAETFRRQFEFNWNLGRELDPHKCAIYAFPKKKN